MYTRRNIHIAFREENRSNLITKVQHKTQRKKSSRVFHWICHKMEDIILLILE